jgi:outer membrane protein OmpA-like peptidoglycan-associated protein
MKRIVFRNLSMVFVLAVVLFASGCAGISSTGEYFTYYSDNPTGNYFFYPKELPAADMAVEDARMAGKHEQCPKVFHKAESLRDEAFEVYNQCNTERAIALANEARALANALCPGMAAPKPAPVVEDLRVKVYFDLDKSIVKEEFHPRLNKAIAYAKKYPKAEILLEGHTDKRAANDYNQALSDRRTKAVKAYITNGGIASSRFKTIGYGETRPNSLNDSESGMAENRRVDVLIMN